MHFSQGAKRRREGEREKVQKEGKTGKNPLEEDKTKNRIERKTLAS